MQQTTLAANAAPLSFTFSDSAVRVVLRDGNPWFLAADVCAAIGIANPRDAVAALDDDERVRVGVSDTKPARRHNLVSESGVYALIFRSNKPQARAFRKWVTSEVLPSIRKSGSYEAKPIPAPPMKAMPEKFRAHFELPGVLHRQLKVLAAVRKTSMRAVLIDLITEAAHRDGLSLMQPRLGTVEDSAHV